MSEIIINSDKILKHKIVSDITDVNIEVKHYCNSYLVDSFIFMQDAEVDIQIGDNIININCIEYVSPNITLVNLELPGKPYVFKDHFEYCFVIHGTKGRYSTHLKNNIQNNFNNYIILEFESFQDIKDLPNAFFYIIVSSETIIFDSFLDIVMESLSDPFYIYAQHDLQIPLGTENIHVVGNLEYYDCSDLEPFQKRFFYPNKNFIIFNRLALNNLNRSYGERFDLKLLSYPYYKKIDFKTLCGYIRDGVVLNGSITHSEKRRVQPKVCYMEGASIFDLPSFPSQQPNYKLDANNLKYCKLDFFAELEKKIGFHDEIISLNEDSDEVDYFLSQNTKLQRLCSGNKKDILVILFTNRFISNKSRIYYLSNFYKESKITTMLNLLYNSLKHNDCIFLRSDYVPRQITNSLNQPYKLRQVTKNWIILKIC